MEMMVSSEEKITVLQGQSLKLLRQLGSTPTALQVLLEADAHCEVVFVAAQAAEATHTIEVEMAGQGAELEIYGLIVADRDDRCAVATKVRHTAENCHSTQLIKGIATANGQGTFDGLVYVAPGAQRTDARQQSRNMLLSTDARIHTNPQLEIYADDVQCSHGATVGNIDDQAIYYMQQRGLSLEQARTLQVMGFVGEILERVVDQQTREELEQQINAVVAR